MKRKFKSIKLYVFIIQFIFSMVALWFGKIDGSQFIDFQKWMVGFYFVANVTSKTMRPKIDFTKYRQN